MAVIYIALVVALALTAFFVHSTLHRRNSRKALECAKDAGVCMDADGNIDAESSFAGMISNEDSTGEKFTGKKARFMEMMRIVSDGPNNADEVRFLVEEGIGAVVRPDGLVYVPRIENEHLYMDGEIDLLEEDLETYLANEEFLTKLENCPAT